MRLVSAFKTAGGSTRIQVAWIRLLSMATAALIPGFSAASEVDSVRAGAVPPRAAAISWTDGRCEGCHTPVRGFSHPVGMRPGRELPAEFPLEGGRMTCVTCHDADSAQTHALARTEGAPMLRGGRRASELCVECHRGSLGSARSAHPTALGRAHLLWEGVRPGRAGTGGLDAVLDERSALCMGCHDGSLAFDAGGHRSGTLFARGREQEHPVGLVYPRGEGGRGRGRLVAAETLDPRIRLFNGTIGCGSCHSLYSPERAYLSMSNQGSGLCLECHEDS